MLNWWKVTLPYWNKWLLKHLSMRYLLKKSKIRNKSNWLQL
ncbi:Uncharacterised protein [Mycobacteroides abscessus subsp. abscessus]|nr:Uncharacterised protein [Mycobacteroides abscessus subsp. abscessus]